jgi:O-methyltransferase involved in polyketide biosynthesis
VAPESTAVRVALWRAMHVQVDPSPHVIEDEVGLQLVAPDEGWRQRPDMDRDAGRGLYVRDDLLDAAGARGFGGASRARNGREGSACQWNAVHQLLHASELLAMASEADFRGAYHVSTAMLAQRYFAGRADGLRPPNNAEEILVATT